MKNLYCLGLCQIPSFSLHTEWESVGWWFSCYIEMSLKKWNGLVIVLNVTWNELWLLCFGCDKCFVWNERWFLLFSTKSWNLRCCSEYHWLGHLKFKIVAKICTNKYFLGYEKCLFSWIWKILRLKRTLIFLFFAIKMKIPLLSWIFYIECMKFESILKIR